jgi:hypothetical protein
VDPVTRRSAGREGSVPLKDRLAARDHPTVSARIDEGTRDGAASLTIHLASPSAHRVALEPVAPFARSRRRESVRERERESEVTRVLPAGANFVHRECHVTVGS